MVLGVLLNLLVWVLAGLNAYCLTTPAGGILNAAALAVCIGSGLYGLSVMSR